MEKWHRDIQRVSLGEAYKGIKVELKAKGNNVEKLFYISPVARPEDVRIEVQGVRGLMRVEDSYLTPPMGMWSSQNPLPISS